MQRSRYLGVAVDKEKGIYERRNEVKQMQRQLGKKEKAILDYGDSYFFNAVIEPLPIYGALKKVFGALAKPYPQLGTLAEPYPQLGALAKPYPQLGTLAEPYPQLGSSFDTLMALVYHRVSGGLAMRFAEDWYDGNYVSRLFPNAKVSSQDISRFLSLLGTERLQRAFFKAYLPLLKKGQSGVVIDSTGLPNEVNMSVTDWGHHNRQGEQIAAVFSVCGREYRRCKHPCKYDCGNEKDRRFHFISAG